MQVEVTESWLETALAIGSLVAVAVAAFVKQYSKSREDERTSVAATPSVARMAVGAAMLDRETANDIAAIRETTSELLRLAEDRHERDDQDRVDRLAREAAREEIRRAGRRHNEE